MLPIDKMGDEERERYLTICDCGLWEVQTLKVLQVRQFIEGRNLFSLSNKIPGFYQSVYSAR